jgi:hypothetical protein
MNNEDDGIQNDLRNTALRAADKKDLGDWLLDLIITPLVWITLSFPMWLMFEFPVWLRQWFHLRWLSLALFLSFISCMTWAYRTIGQPSAAKTTIFDLMARVYVAGIPLWSIFGVMGIGVAIKSAVAGAKRREADVGNVKIEVSKDLNLLDRARYYEVSGNPEKARAILIKAIQKEPGRSDLRRALQLLESKHFST